MTEDALIEAIAALTSGNRRTTVGIGDDAAVWQPSRSHRSVISTDALVEDVHFSRAWMSDAEIGWRSMASNLSDLAAMGATPRLATVALGIPAAYARESILDLYRGIAGCARRFDLAIAGGDLTRAPVLSIAITVVGEVRPQHVKLRSTARVGDVIAVTGALGASRAGLDAARGAVALSPEDVKVARAAHVTPEPRIAEGRWLAASAHVHAMMDCSDGLSTDLGRMMRASARGALIERVPVAPVAAAAAHALETDADAYALAGGEEYELLVTVQARAFEHLADRFRARFRRALEPVGRVRADAGLAMVKQGREEPILPTGWDHFR